MLRKQTISQTDLDILNAYANCDMVTRKTARTLSYNLNTVSYHLNKIKEVTGLDPKNFWELVKLLEKYSPDTMRIKLDINAIMPVRAHDTDAGLDLISPIDTMIPANGSVIINTGVHVELPKNTAGMLKSKSGLNVKYGITSEGVIDVGYTGAIVAKLYNNSSEPFYIKRGDKITQLVIVPVLTPKLEVVDELDDTERGEKGFGSTGR